MTNNGAGNGVVGRTASDTASAVYGDNTGSGFAGYFEDKVHIGGVLDCNNCIDGADVTGVMRGQAVGQGVAPGPGSQLFLGPAIGGFMRMTYKCPSPTSNDGTLIVTNSSTSLANVFVESGDANPFYIQLGAGGFVTLPASASGDSFHIQAQGALGVLTIEAATVNRASDCHAQAQGVLTN